LSHVSLQADDPRQVRQCPKDRTARWPNDVRDLSPWGHYTAGLQAESSMIAVFTSIKRWAKSSVREKKTAERICTGTTG